MTKLEIIDNVVDRTALNRAQANEVVTSVFESMADSLTKGESIFIRGFGTIKVQVTKPKKARNLNTGATIEVPSCKTARLVICKSLKESMNK